MKKFLCLALFIPLAACTTKDDAGGDTAAAAIEGMAADLWDATAGYDGWDQLDPWIGVQASLDGTHGSHVQVWLNDTAIATAGADTIADGGILFKESYDDDSGATPNSYTAMWKVDGWAPDNGDWFWAQWDTDGNLSNAGEISGCYGCHESGVDYVRISEPPAR